MTESQDDAFDNLFKVMSRHIPLSEELKGILLKNGTLISIKKKEYLLKAGDICRHGYFICEGYLAHLYLNDDGEDFVIGFSDRTTNPYLSAPSYISGKESSFELMALKDSRVLAFTKEFLEQTAYDSPDFSKFYIHIIAGGLLKQYEYSAIRLSCSSRELLIRFNKVYPGLIDNIPDKYIARFMGISQEWFSKLKKALNQRGT